jgi:hypothetical protein
MAEDIKPESNPKPEWVASYGGFPIYIDRALAPGWVEFRNSRGELLGMINDVGEIRIAPSRPPTPNRNSQ